MAVTAQLGLAVRSFLQDIVGGIVGKTKALRNLGVNSWVWTAIASIGNYDYLNPEGRGRTFQLSAKDLYALRNLRSNLQSQVNAFGVITQNIKDILASVFPKLASKTTVALVYPTSGAVEDLRISAKLFYVYVNGQQQNTYIEDPITFTPTSATECLLDIGISNGESPEAFIQGAMRPLQKTGDSEAIYDFDSITIEWVEDGVTKRRSDMQIKGPFYSSDSFASEFIKTETGGGREAFVLQMCRGTGDTFSNLIAQSVQNKNCTIVKKQERKFVCVTNHTIKSANIASIQRTANVTRVILKGNYDWLGNSNYGVSEIGDDRIVRGQPVIIRASGALADFAGSYVISSVDRPNKSFTFQNVSLTAPTTSLIPNPAIEISVEPFYTTQFRLGEAVTMSFARIGNNSIVDHYTDLVVGESFNDGLRKGFYLYGKPDVSYNLVYQFEPGFGWGYRQAAIITNYPTSEIKGSSKVFTSRHYIRGYANPRAPSVTRGNIISTSTKSFWNRTTAKIPETVLNLSFPGQVQVNGSLEVKQQINFGNNALLTEFSTSLTGASTASPFYNYFNKEKQLTHFFQIKVGGENCYLPAVSLEDQVFKYDQVVNSKQGSLSQTAVVALDKFYTAGNNFVFPLGGNWKSSANANNIFFGEIFQPFVRVNSSPYVSQYANIMTTKEHWLPLNRLPTNANETGSSAGLNQYYETMPSSTFNIFTRNETNINPTAVFRSAFNGVTAYQDYSTADKDTLTHFPTNAGTFIMVFKLRTDWSETQPEAVQEDTPQIICGQGVDWEVVQNRPLGGSVTNYWTENGLGWLMYTKKYDTSNRSLYFTNPGPWEHLTNTNFRNSIDTVPVRNIDFNKTVECTKKLAPNLFYFVAATFSTKDTNNVTLSNTDMEAKQTASLTPNAYPSGYSSFLPTTAFLNAMLPTTVNFYIGEGTSSLVNMTPNNNSVKIVRSTKRTPSFSNKFGRRLGVGLPVYFESSSSTQFGWYNGFSNNVLLPYSYELYRVAAPMDFAFVGQIDDVMSDVQLTALYSSLRQGTFKDLNWGSPI